MDANERLQIVNEIIKLREWVFNVKTGDDFNNVYDLIEKVLYRIRRDSKIFIDKKLILMSVEDFEGHIISDTIKNHIREI